MAKIEVTIKSDTDLVNTGVDYHPNTGKICIKLRGQPDSHQNVVIPKGKTARWTFDVDEMDALKKITDIKVLIGGTEKRKLN